MTYLKHLVACPKDFSNYTKQTQHPPAFALSKRYVHRETMTCLILNEVRKYSSIWLCSLYNLETKHTNRDLTDIFETPSTEDVSNYTKQMQHPPAFALSKRYVHRETMTCLILNEVRKYSSIWLCSLNNLQMKLTNRDLPDIFETPSTEDVSNYTEEMQHPAFALSRTNVHRGPRS